MSILGVSGILAWAACCPIWYNVRTQNAINTGLSIAFPATLLMLTSTKSSGLRQSVEFRAIPRTEGKGFVGFLT